MCWEDDVTRNEEERKCSGANVVTTELNVLRVLKKIE
jgi:hypothetical protein